MATLISMATPPKFINCFVWKSLWYICTSQRDVCTYTWLFAASDKWNEMLDQRPFGFLLPARTYILVYKAASCPRNLMAGWANNLPAFFCAVSSGQRSSQVQKSKRCKDNVVIHCRYAYSRPVIIRSTSPNEVGTWNRCFLCMNYFPNSWRGIPSR